ncbi:MAG TPA: hypothetical protein VHP83_21840 [Aggregatilineaceae bacterium]|nr:hypothetical protein [Aggregatilineaceae bacterium]
MRKITLLLGLGLLVIVGVLVFAAGSNDVRAQTDPTATVNLPGLPLRTRQPTATPAVVGETPVPTEEATDDGLLDLLWLQLESGFGSVSVYSVAAGGPVDTFAFIGTPCAENVFSAQLPAFELHLLTDSKRIVIGYKADDGRATAVMMWHPGEEQWWCNTQATYDSAIEFDTLPAGDYPIYVAVQGSQEITTGTITITEYED